MTYVEVINRDFENCVSQMIATLNALQRQSEALESLGIQERLNGVERFKQVDDLAEKIRIIELLKEEKEFIKDALSEVDFPLPYHTCRTTKGNGNEFNEQITKVTKRVPTWFRKYFIGLNPCNGTILVRFLELSSENSRCVNRYELEEACKSVSNFTTNYHNMRNMLPNNHGKVFEEINGEITLWKPVAEIVLEAYSKAKSLQNSSNSLGLQS